MSSFKMKIRKSGSLVRLLLVGGLAVLTFQISSTPSGAIGFGGNNCPQFCEQLCNGQRLQCYDFCDNRYPGNQPALDQCYWDCSLQMGTCRDNCLGHCF